MSVTSLPTIARPPRPERSTTAAVTPKPGRSMSPDAPETTDGVPANSRWCANFDADRLALLELRMWKAYYRRQPARLFGLLVMGLREQARVSWPRAVLAAVYLTRAAVGFARSSGDYERFAPDIGRGYRTLGLPSGVDVEAVARHELRWWVVRREIGLAAGEAAG